MQIVDERGPGLGLAEPAMQRPGMLGLLRVLWAWRLLIGLAVLAGTALAAAVVLRLPPRYDAEVLLLWSPPWMETQIATGPGQGGASQVLDTNVVRGVVAILASDEMARRVVADMGLQERPEFALPTGRFSRPPAPETQEQARFQHAVTLYRRGLRIMNDGRSYAIGINVQSSDGQLAAAMANRHAALYLAAEREARQRIVINAREWLDGEVQRLSDRLRGAEAALRDNRERRGPGNEQPEVTMRAMEREVSASRGVYEALLARQREFAARESVPNMDARLISAAVAPLQPSGPNRPLLLVLASLSAFTLAAGFALAREFFRAGFSTAEALEDATGLRAMGVLPAMPDLAGTILRLPDSAAAEAVRSLRTTLAMSPLLGGRPRILAVVPADAGDGGTSLALARSLARTECRVLLVETDIRRAGPLPPGPDLIAVLQGEAPLATALRDDAQPGLRRLAAAAPASAAARDLLASPALGRVLDAARPDFDWIILDTPPLGPVLDGILVARHAQGTLLILRAGRTPQAAVLRAIRALHDVGAPVIGTVLSGVKTSQPRHP